MEFKLGSEKRITQRNVYNIFAYASDIGGLQGALDSIFGFLMSFFAPLMFSRSVLRHNYKYDSNTSAKR